MPAKTTCPEHNIRDCGTCYTDPGRCEFGGRTCGGAATHTVNHERETRRFCERHATSPRFAFARVGCWVS